jgi:hypothetical protein
MSQMQAENESEEYVDMDPEMEGQTGEGDTRWSHIKATTERFLESRYFWFVVCILLAIISFVLGRPVIQGERVPVKVVVPSEAQQALSGSKPVSTEGGSTESAAAIQSQTTAAERSGEEVVASKNGSKYHYPWCGGAKQISEKNKITFASIAEARAAGYTPAGNCKGLK